MGDHSREEKETAEMKAVVVFAVLALAYADSFLEFDAPASEMALAQVRQEFDSAQQLPDDEELLALSSNQLSSSRFSTMWDVSQDNFVQLHKGHKSHKGHKHHAKKHIFHHLGGKGHKYVKGETKLRGRIKAALKVATKSLHKAHGKKTKLAAKAAVKAALADAGVVDADNAGTIAWANRNLDLAKKWAYHALHKDAKALGKVAAWKAGDRKIGIKMRRKCERAVQSMIAVASATKNKAMVAREAKLRSEGKLKSYDGPIKHARKAAREAGKMVTEARAALAATLGTKARIAARHALLRAENAMHDANMILRTAAKQKNVITSNRLQSDGARLVGESELHYRCRKTFHRANRVLKLVTAALNHARKNHFAHKEALMKQQQKMTMEKAAKLQHRERRAKSEARRKALGIKTKQEYAAYLAKKALRYGQLARDDARKSAKAGKLAAMEALRSANVKAELSGKPVKKGSTKTVNEALERENIAASLATKAAKMEDAIVSGGRVPKEVEQIVMDSHGKITAPFMDAVAAKVDQQTQKKDYINFKNHKGEWKKQYSKHLQQELKKLKAH